MSSKAYIRTAMQKWNSNDAHDNIEKNRLQKILKKHFQFSCLFDCTIFVSKEYFTWRDIQPDGSKEEIYKKYTIHRPDILIKNPPIIIELDGLFHFNTRKGVNQTKLRNTIYNSMDISFIPFHTNEFNKMTDVEIINEIRAIIDD